ncbi:MAG: glutamine synthetase [Armatimonadetes bacterium]|nr:glutamine synthetase [Armatimonadota bacterium]
MAGNMVEALGAQGVRFLRVVWCDNANLIRAKAVHLGSIQDQLEHGVGISPAQQAVPVTADAFVKESGLGPVGEIRLVPDWDTLTILPYAPGHARVYGDMMRDGKPWTYCPRDFLRRMVRQAADAGITFKAAFENEFYLFEREDEVLAPVDETLFCSVQSMNLNREFVDQLAEALLAQSIPVMQYYPESGGGQQEMSIGHTSPLEAADRQLAFRESVHAVANQLGLKASFLPKIFLDKAGSGCHLHLSLWRDGKNLRMATETHSFIAGILHHLPALMAVTTPIPNSYRRLSPHSWSGAFTCWGMGNREAAVRVVPEPDGSEPQQFELKTMDASANPYLALGAVIAAGLDGIKRQLEPGESVSVDPGLLSEQEREKRGIRRLPFGLAESLGNLRGNSVLKQAMGKELAKAFISVRSRELADLENLELDEEVALLLERY